MQRAAGQIPSGGAVREREIPAALAKLGRAIAEVDDVVTNLLMRLESSCTPSVPTTANRATAPGEVRLGTSAPIACEIENNVERVNVIIQKVGDVNNRLEL